MTHLTRSNDKRRRARVRAQADAHYRANSALIEEEYRKVLAAWGLKPQPYPTQSVTVRADGA